MPASEPTRQSWHDSKDIRAAATQEILRIPEHISPAHHANRSILDAFDPEAQVSERNFARTHDMNSEPYRMVDTATLKPEVAEAFPPTQQEQPQLQHQVLTPELSARIFSRTYLQALYRKRDHRGGGRNQKVMDQRSIRCSEVREVHGFPTSDLASLVRTCEKHGPSAHAGKPFLGTPIWIDMSLEQDEHQDNQQPVVLLQQAYARHFQEQPPRFRAKLRMARGFRDSLLARDADMELGDEEQDKFEQHLIGA